MGNDTPETDKYEQSLGMEGAFDSNFARLMERTARRAEADLLELADLVCRANCKDWPGPWTVKEHGRMVALARRHAPDADEDVQSYAPNGMGREEA